MREERGQATVEFALIVPVVLLVIVGLIQFGKGFNYWLNLNHLANEGARWAVVNKVPTYSCSAFSGSNNTTPSSLDLEKYLYCQMPNTELRDKVGNPTTATGTSHFAVCFPAGTSQIGDPVSVKIKSPYNVGFGPLNVPITLTGKATMRLEQIPSYAQQAGAGCP